VSVVFGGGLEYCLFVCADDVIIGNQWSASHQTHVTNTEDVMERVTFYLRKLSNK
jgi:hypothetical protein